MFNLRYSVRRNFEISWSQAFFSESLGISTFQSLPVRMFQNTSELSAPVPEQDAYSTGAPSFLLTETSGC